MILVGGVRVRWIWRRLLAWRFRLFQQHRHRHLALEQVDGVPILVLPDVFNPKLFRTGAVLGRYLSGINLQGASVLDMGTGSGVGAVFAARRGARVVAVDINPEAVRCARINALLNRVEERVDVRRGDLFEPVSGERFDLVLLNPPFYAGQPREDWEYAWRSDHVIERFAAGLGDVLRPSGRSLVVLSTDAAGAMAQLDRHGLHRKVVWQREYGNERLMLMELSAPETSEVLLR